MVAGGSVLQDFFSLDRLNHCVMMIAMDLSVNGGSHVLMPPGVEMLFSDSCLDILVNICGVLAIVGDEVGHGLLGFLHDE